jgi:uncharacterized protein (TIGR02231 family)
MRMIADSLVTSGFVLVTALGVAQAQAAELDATSAVDAVTVYPDGASVTRVIAVDLPAGDNTLVASDFPLVLDPSSLRVEGEADSKFTIGAIDTWQPPPTPVDLPELDKRIEALNDKRADLQGMIAAATARRKFAERFAQASPAGIGDKGEARPIAEWRDAFAAVSDEVATADAAIRDAERKQRDIDREIARLETDRAAKPSSKLEVRIDLAATAATKATLRVTYAVRNARWVPLYDTRLDTGTKDRKPALELVRRAEITQTTGENWSNVALAVSTVRTARGGSAPDLNSLIVQYPPSPLGVVRGDGADRSLPRQQFDVPASASAAAVAEEALKKPANEQEASAEVDSFHVTFKIPGRVSLGANEGAKSLRISTSTFAPDPRHPLRAGGGSDRVYRGEFHRERGCTAVAGTACDLSRRRVCRPRQDARSLQGRNGAARFRRRRQGQDRALGGEAQRGVGGLDRDFEDRRAFVQDQRAQRPRFPDQGSRPGSTAGQ